ncbi:hypothetical protein D3C71_2017590 [compost metagenome]
MFNLTTTAAMEGDKNYAYFSIRYSMGYYYSPTPIELNPASYRTVELLQSGTDEWAQVDVGAHYYIW